MSRSKNDKVLRAADRYIDKMIKDPEKRAEAKRRIREGLKGRDAATVAEEAAGDDDKGLSQSEEY